jgi:hypothetical protein
MLPLGPDGIHAPIPPFLRCIRVNKPNQSVRIAPMNCAFIVELNDWI